jgi:glycosyltransferase involved in cell wall biosynthesis
MTAAPLLSYIVLSYNYQNYIRVTLESILRQTVQDFEIVVVDDASSDASVEVIRSYHDPRIRLFVNDRNIGGAASYNRAVEAAVGEWLVNLDADDWIAPEKAERQLAFAAADPGLDIIGTYVNVVDAEGNRHSDADAIEAEYNKPHAVEWLNSWLHYNPLARSSSMVRRAAHMCIGLDDPAMVRACDYELWTRFLRHGHRFGMVPEKLTFLRLQSRGVTRGDPLGSLLEIAYARLRNLLPLLEKKAQYPSFLQLVRWLITEPNLNALPPVQLQRLVGLPMAPPPEGDYLTFCAYLADATRDSWLATVGRRLLAYDFEFQENVGQLHRALGEAEHWRQAAAALQAEVANYRSQSGVPEMMLRKMRTTWAYRLAARAYSHYYRSS